MHGRPYILLTNTRSKCFSVIAPHDQVITVEYHAPDLILPPDTMAEATQKRRLEQGKEEPAGLDSEWNKRMKERLERIKNKKMRDTSITVMQRGLSFSNTKDNKQTTNFDEEGNIVTSGTGRIREELSQENGRIEFLTGKDAGTVEICVQSISASPKRPARLHVMVKDEASDNEYDDDDGYYDDDDHVSDSKANTKKVKDPDHLEHRELTQTMTRLERDLQSLQNRIKACINNADFNKDQEHKFHEQSVSMNRATKYWPIIQLIVLILTGFTQANHIVGYLKSHRIV